MSLIQILLLSFGVGADAFAVAVARGTQIRRSVLKRSVVLAVIFGAFTFAMPTLGWLVGRYFAEFDYISRIDHWISFALMAAVGGKMIWDVLHQDGEEAGEPDDEESLGLRPALILGLATSIDAFAVGMGLAFVVSSILPIALSLGLATLLMALAGAWIGHHGGSRFGGWATIAGGLILIGLGIRFVVSHYMG